MAFRILIAKEIGNYNLHWIVFSRTNESKFAIMLVITIFLGNDVMVEKSLSLIV